MVRARVACLVAVIVVVAPGTARAQTSVRRLEFALGAGVTYGKLVGGDFSGSKAALGVDANAGIVLGRWQLGVGYDRTNHDHADTNGDYVVSNVYVETKLLFVSARAMTPYAAVRLGRAMASYEGVLGITDKATGYIAGLGAGVWWPIAGHVQADGAVHYDRLSHDYGTGGYSDAERGGRVGVSLGLRVGIPR